MPNIENIDLVIEAIKREQIAHFYMNIWWTDNLDGHCGSYACIGGFCNMLANMQAGENFMYDARAAARFLGIDHDTTGSALFFGFNAKTALRDITPEVAIAGLEMLKRDEFHNWDDVMDAVEHDDA